MSDLLRMGHCNRAIGLPEEEALLEQHLHVSLGLLDLLDLLLHLVKLCHPGCNVCLLLLRPQFLLLDLSPGLSALGTRLHQMARLAL